MSNSRSIPLTDPSTPYICPVCLNAPFFAPFHFSIIYTYWFSFDLWGYKYLYIHRRKNVGYGGSLPYVPTQVVTELGSQSPTKRGPKRKCWVVDQISYGSTSLSIHTHKLLTKLKEDRAPWLARCRSVSLFFLWVDGWKQLVVVDDAPSQLNDWKKLQET